MTGKFREKRKWFLILSLVMAVWIFAGSQVMAAAAEKPGAGGGQGQAGENTLEIQFCGKDGTVYNSLTKKMTLGSTLILPAVPSWEGKKNSGWKLEKDGPDIDGFVLMEGESLLLSMEDSLADYIEGGKLRLYAVEPFRITFWNNSGTSSFSHMDVFPGEEISLPDFPNSKYVDFGWTSVKGGSEVEYGLGQSYTAEKNADLYMVRYSTSKVMTVSFYGMSGGTNAQFKALKTQVVKGKKLTLPEVPVTTGYTNLGWSTKKNASKAKYSPGETITVKKNMKFYAVRKKLTSFLVTFNNNAGTSTSRDYLALKKKIYKGQYIELPAVPPAKGTRGLGWTTVRKGKKVQYKVGARVKVTKNLNFYAVTEKIVTYTVKFYDTNGTQGSYFSSLKKTVAENTDFELPALPQKKGSVGMGWSTRKNSSVVTYQAGAKIRVKKNLSLYAVYKTSVTVTLYKNDGSLYQTINVGKGEYFTLPSVQSKAPYTMLGWSSSRGRTLDPEFEVGQSLRVVSNKKFYAVVFNRSKEPDYELTALPAPDISKYRKVIFVGDSRTQRMALTFTKAGGGSFLKNVSFVAKGGEGLAWFESDGYAELLKEIEGDSRLPAAVIFNLGINDLTNMDNYVSYYRSIAGELIKRGCKLYCMSLNPINSENLKAAGRGERKEETVRTFNSTIRSGLCTGSGALCTYIDTYSYLIKNGYGSDSGSQGADSGVDDGLHYTIKTYKRIYKYCIDFLNGTQAN